MQSAVTNWAPLVVILGWWVVRFVDWFIRQLLEYSALKDLTELG